MSIANAFQSILNNSKRKPNKIWVDQCSEFYNNHIKKWLKGNDVEMYSTHNEGKSVVAKRFIRTLKNKIYKHMTAISKNVYFHVLDDLVKKYNNTYHKTIKMKPIDIKSYFFAEYNEESNEKDSKFKIGDHVSILKIFFLKNCLNGEESLENFYKKELQKTNQKNFRIEKVIKRKGNRLYVKCKGYNNSFNSWIDKNDLIKWG